MVRLTTFAAIGAVLTFAAGTAFAGPSNGAGTLPTVAATISSIAQAHGCHRRCVRGWVPRWGVVRFHRQVGPHCVAVRC
jgi:hypothetical protein